MVPAPKRVMIVIGQLSRGGAERQVHELATRLDRSRYLPVVVTFEPGGHYQPLLESAGVEVVVLDKRGWREATAPTRLATLMRRRRVDIVHAFLFPANWRAVLAARMARVRGLVCAVRSTGLWMTTRHRLMDRMTLRCAGVVVVNAPAVRDDVLLRVGVDPTRVRVIMNGVDTGLFHPGGSKLRGEWEGDGGGQPIIGFVGSLRQAKDPILFIGLARRVAARVPTARFVLVGDGPLRSRLEALCRDGELSGRVVFAGERGDIPEVLRAIDVIAVTSEREGCCNVILEAMATGVPIAATAVGGNPDLVTDGVNGRLFPYGDAEAGAEAVISMLPGGEVRRRISAAGLARARADFSVETMVMTTESLYETLA